jgi:hypothetical protein
MLLADKPVFVRLCYLAARFRRFLKVAFLMIDFEAHFCITSMRFKRSNFVALFMYRKDSAEECSECAIYRVSPLARNKLKLAL